MAKKHRPASAKTRPQQPSFDPENSRWFVPVVFVFLFLALVILFSQFLFSGDMLFGSDTLQAGVMFRSFLVNYFHDHGRIPQWSPYLYGGMPYIEAFHGDIFYPFSVLKFFGSIYRMLGLNLFLHIFFAGIFMYLTARQFGLQKLPSLFSAAGFMFSGYLVSLVAPGHDGKIFVTTLYPLTILFFDRAFHSRAFLNFSLAGLVIGLIILTPHPQMAYFTLWSLALYTIFRMVLIIRERKNVLPAITPGVLAVYAVAIGLLISAIQFYPGYNYTTHYSPRADTKQGWEWATSWSMHEEEALSTIIPEFSGTNTHSDVKTIYWGKNPFKDNSESVGITMVFLALIGAGFSRRKEGYFFAGLAIFAFVYALGGTTPIFKLFYYVIPKVKSLRAAGMIMFLFTFSVSLLGGMGVQYLIDSQRNGEPGARRRQWFTYLLYGVPGAMLLIAVLFTLSGRGMINLWTSIFFSEAGSTSVAQGITKLDLAYRNLGAIQSGAWIAFLTSGLAALFIWMHRTGKAGTGILLALLAIPVVDGVRFNKRFVSTIDPEERWASTPVTSFFEKTDGVYRAINLQTPVDNTLPYFGTQVVAGYHGNQLRWYDDLIGGLPLKNIYNARVLNLVGAEYLVMPGQQGVPEGYFGSAPVTTAASFGNLRIIHNENALPRVYLADSVEVYQDRQDIYPLVTESTKDLRRIVLLEQAPGLEIHPDSLPSDSTWIKRYGDDSVLVGVSTSHNRMLVITDVYYDAWKARVDGAPAEVLRSYGAFRAVPVPAGSSEVLFYFESARYLTGRWITWLTLLYLLVVFGVATVWSRRKSSGSSPPEPE